MDEELGAVSKVDMDFERPYEVWGAGMAILLLT